MSAPATIADIARQAGVGTATVDRVLNRRPGVNAETVQRVLQVVAELGAPPQRGRPRRGDNFRFAFVLPAEATPFVELVDRQIALAAGEFRHQHITEVTHRLPTADGTQFAAALAQVADCDAVALMAPDLPPVKLAINELVRSGVHVVTLFSDVAGSMRETHVGADNRAAGRTAGLLLARMAGGARDTLLLALRATRLSADDDGAARALAAFLEGAERKRIAGLASQVALAGHDFTDQHRSLLGAGALAYVLHQVIHGCAIAAARVLRALCENVRGALNVVQPRVEILTAENLH
jgi:LacI family transcriptional regulator